MATATPPISARPLTKVLAVALSTGRPSARQRRRTMAAAILAAAFAAIAPAAANAGIVGVTGKIVGAGTISSTSGGPYSCDRTWNTDDRVEVSCQREIFSAIDPVKAHVSLSATPRSVPGGHWEFVRWEGCDSLEQNNSICVVRSGHFSRDLLGNLIIADWAPKAIFRDNHPPNVQISGSALLPNRGARVSFTTNEGSTECQLDDRSWSPCAPECSSPPCNGAVEYTSLLEGQHTVRVRGTDGSGKSDTKSTTFRIVDTALTGLAENALVNSRTVQFSFSSVGGTAFECGFKAASSAAPVSYSACASPQTVTVPADGHWTFFVRASDGAFVDPVPAMRTWRVDTAKPTVSLNPLFGPPQDAIVTTTSAVLDFTASEPVARFECTLDGGQYQPCTSPYTASNLTSGPHAFAVRAVDHAGNMGDPATRSWTVAPDDDRDGHRAGPDCDDSKPEVNPAASDTPDNGVDENCDGRDAVNLDRDADGYDRNEPGGKAPFDCDDAKAAINPGALDVPRNKVDEDCDGRDADYPSITSEVRYAANRKGGKARIRRLSVIRPPDGAMVTLKCRGKGCTFKRRRQVAAPGTSALSFAADLRKAKLRRGAVVEVWITRSGMRGKVVRLRVGRGAKVSAHTLCVEPGSKKPGGCPAG
jgi:putative metal-binding protein